MAGPSVGVLLPEGAYLVLFFESHIPRPHSAHSIHIDMNRLICNNSSQSGNETHILFLSSPKERVVVL